MIGEYTWTIKLSKLEKAMHNKGGVSYYCMSLIYYLLINKVLFLCLAFLVSIECCGRQLFVLYLAWWKSY